jgi:hypothetical protein
MPVKLINLLFSNTREVERLDAIGLPLPSKQGELDWDQSRAGVRKLYGKKDNLGSSEMLD